MFFALIKSLLFLITRPLALYLIYPGAVAFLNDNEELEKSYEELIKSGGQELVLETSDARKIEAMYFEAGENTKGTVLFCLGNQMFLQNSNLYVDYYKKLGFNVMVFNYGGFAKSEGFPSAEKTFEDTETAYKYLKNNKNTKDEELIVHGFSLGGGPATYLASKYPIHLVLDRSYAKIGNATKIPLVGHLANYLYPYDNQKRIKNVKGRIHFLEAIEDEMMGPENVENLLTEIQKNTNCDNARKRFVTSFHGRHVDSIFRQKRNGNSAPSDEFIEKFILHFG